MMVGSRLLARLLILLFLLGLTLQLMAVAGLRPAWARVWPGLPVRSGSLAGAPALTLAELRRLRPYRAGSEAQPLLDLGQGTVLAHQDLLDLLGQVFAAVRAAEGRQRQAALAEEASYLEQWVARRLVAARLRWEQRFRDEAIGLGEKNDLVLKACAAELRREYFPTVSSLELRIELCEDSATRQSLEAKLAEVLSLMEKEIARQREDLSQQCALELGNLRKQAEEELSNLASMLKEEMHGSLAAFAAAQDLAYADWMADDASSEASAKQAGVLLGL